MLFIFGRSEADCLAFLEGRGLKFVRGVTHFITNLNWTRVLDIRFNPGDKVYCMSSTPSDILEILAKRAKAQGYNLGGNR